MKSGAHLLKTEPAGVMCRYVGEFMSLLDEETIPASTVGKYLIDARKLVEHKSTKNKREKERECSQM